MGAIKALKDKTIMGESATKHPKKWATAIMELTTFTQCALELATYKWVSHNYGTKKYHELPSSGIGRKLHDFLPLEMRQAKKIKPKEAQKVEDQMARLRMAYRSA